MRVVAACAALALLLVGCGSGDDSRGEQERPPLSMHPVLDVDQSGDCALSGEFIRRSADGFSCYSLSPGFTTARYQAEEARVPGPTVGIEVTLEAGEMKRFNELAGICFGRQVSCPTQQIAILYNDKVMSAPTVQEPSFTGSIMITSEDEDELKGILAGRGD